MSGQSSIDYGDSTKQKPYIWSNGAQLSHPELKHPVSLNYEQLLVAFNAKYKPVTLKQLRRKLQLTNYRNVHYNKWKDEITKLVEKRKSNGTVIRPFIKQTVVLPNLHKKYDWTGEARTLLTELAREQRISQFCDTSIVSHPYGFNLSALLSAFNERHDNEITLQQLQSKIHKGNIYNDANYEQWKGKIAELAEERKSSSSPIKFTKSTNGLCITYGVKWIEDEIKIGREIINEPKNANSTQEALIHKIFEALHKNRTVVAIKVSFFRLI